MVPSLMKCFILIMLENIIEKLYGLVLCVSRENKSQDVFFRHTLCCISERDIVSNPFVRLNHLYVSIFLSGIPQRLVLSERTHNPLRQTNNSRTTNNRNHASFHQHQPPQFLPSLAQLPHNSNLAEHQHLPSLIFSITVFSLCELAKTEVAFYTFLTMLSACVLEQVFFWVGGVLLGLEEENTEAEDARKSVGLIELTRINIGPRILNLAPSLIASS